MPESKPKNEAKTPAPAVKAEAPKAAPAPGEKKPDAPAKAPEKPKDIPAADPKPKNIAAEPPKGVRITQVLADRLEKPSEGDLKKIPQPKEGESISMRLHPGYFFEFLDASLNFLVGMLYTKPFRNCTTRRTRYTAAAFLSRCA